MEKINHIDKKSKSILYYPIKLVEIYLCCTIVLYILGPWDWPTHNPILLYLFIFLAQFFLWVGYRKSINKSMKVHINPKTEIKVLKLLKYAIVVNLIFIILNTTRNTGMNSFSLNLLLEKAMNGMLNPVQQYKEKFNSATYGGSLLTYTTVILSPLLWSVIPLSLFYFKKLSSFNKIMAVASIVFEALRWMATGTNKGIFDLIIIFITISIIKKKQKMYMSISNSKKTKKKKVIFLLMISLMLAIGFFSNSINSRVKGNWNSLMITNGYVQINFDSFLMRICPHFLQSTLIYLTSYLTQGYYALSMAITLPFTPMFGVGNSTFLMENVGQLFNVDLYQFTYQMKLKEYGWDPFVNWHSFYVWAANDVHFIGVIGVMFILGYYFASIYKDAIINKNPLAVVIMCLLTLMFIYIPANNQVPAYPTTFMSFWVLTIYWLVQKYKLRYKKIGRI